jgi:hypothetical protein
VFAAIVENKAPFIQERPGGPGNFAEICPLGYAKNTGNLALTGAAAKVSSRPC